MLAAASPSLGRGHLLTAFEGSTNAGPWDSPDAYRKFNAVVRYSRGDAVNGLTITGMGTPGKNEKKLRNVVAIDFSPLGPNFVCA